MTNHFEAPMLDDESIHTAVHSGLLGEQICHVTVDQLKDASSALFLQVCVSILNKLDVDTDHLGQSFLRPFFNTAEHYQSSGFFAAHVPRYFHALIPGCTPKIICTFDLLRPKWKKIKRFLSVAINYLRFVQNNNEKFQELNIKSEELRKNVCELEDSNIKLHQSLQEVIKFMVDNASVQQKQNKEYLEVEKDLQEICLRRKDTDSRKDESKICLENLKSTLSTIKNQDDQVSKKIEDVKSLIVSSPEKQISEKKDLHHQLDACKDEASEVSDQVQSYQWNIDKKEEIIKRLGYGLKQLRKYQEFYEKLRTIKAGLMKEQFQTNDDNMSLVCIKQEIDKLKQRKIDERDQIFRTKQRSKHTLETQKQRLQDINKQIDLLHMQAEDKAKIIISLHSEIDQQNKDIDKENHQREEKVKEIESIKTELYKLVEQTFINYNMHIKEISSQRLQALEAAVDSKFD